MITDEELLRLTEREIGEAQDYLNTEVSADREKALKYYMGDKLGNEQDGRSQVVSTDVSDTVESILPSLMRIFAGSDRVVSIEPHGEEDVEAANVAEEWANYVLFRQNPGYELLYTWFKDALLAKNGVVKCYWRDDKEYSSQKFAGLSDEAAQLLIQQGNVTKMETDDVEGHTVTVTNVTDKSQIVIENVPPEEFIISRFAKSIDDAPFMAHRIQRTLSDLREAGYTNVEELQSYTNDINDGERQERWEDMYADEDDGQGDPSMRQIWLYECYMKVDCEDTGIAEWYKITRAGDTILDKEPIDKPPFHSICPVPVPHRYFGRSLADLTIETQDVKTAITRQMLDNIYVQNNPRVTAVMGQVEIKDLATSRPNQIIPVRQQGAVQPVPTAPLQPWTFDLLSHIENEKEARTGVTKLNQGQNLDAGAFQNTATGMTLLQQAGNQRIELIARNFAETGLKSLVQAVVELTGKYMEESKVIRVTNKPFLITPDNMNRKFDYSIDVAVGSMSQEQRLAHLMALGQVQEKLLMAGSPMVSMKNLHSLVAEMIRNMGFKNVSDFITEVPDMPPQQDKGESDAMMLAAQAEMAKAQADMAEVQQKQQLSQQQMALEMEKLELERAELQMKASELGIKLDIAQMQDMTKRDIAAANNMTKLQ